MEDKFRQIKDIISEIEVDVNKFHNRNNKSAGIRVRKAMQDVKNLAQDIRMHILKKNKI